MPSKSAAAVEDKPADKALPSINTVTKEEFHRMHIPGFTGSRIDSIIDYRDSLPNKKFESFEQIMDVPMLGGKMEKSIEMHFSL